ncbi:MAG: gluconokinase [Boseongicola sp. SB0662_bin_57]|nr:gluconokinase [Boseongicola sp. SB0662_bin_57]
MGVSGCGKSSVGAAVAEGLGIRYIDGDDLHPSENIAKMSRGEPLTDADRAPWLVRVGQRLAETDGPVVIGCSALKRAYRDIIRDHAAESLCFLHLEGSRETLFKRMANRSGHFMPVSLLESQLATLEPPGLDETAITADIDQPFDKLVDALVAKIREGGS